MSLSSLNSSMKIALSRPGVNRDGGFWHIKVEKRPRPAGRGCFSTLMYQKPPSPLRWRAPLVCCGILWFTVARRGLHNFKQTSIPASFVFPDVSEGIFLNLPASGIMNSPCPDEMNPVIAAFLTSGQDPFRRLDVRSHCRCFRRHREMRRMRFSMSPNIM